jgi:NAD(P)-dependent dehydrogenase (short-subunit alcohol dehydrogenase family)
MTRPAGAGRDEAPVAVVTGAAQGLGAETARILHERGYWVVAADLDLDAMRATARGIGERVAAARLDVRDEQGCFDLAAEVAARHDRLDVWVNNAGVLSTAPAWEQAPARQRMLVEVNTLGTIFGTCAALGQMRPRGRGAVVNVVSLAGLSPVPGMAAYSASKHASLAFSLSTLAELRAVGENNISISCLCPGGIWTPMLQTRTDDPWAALPFGGRRLLTPAEVAERAVGLVERPKPVLAVPRVMGPVSRLLSAFPRSTVLAAPVMLRIAQRQQRRNARRLAQP